MTAIPRELGQIWIGPLEPPLDWMRTWADMHPDWTYTLYDNAYMLSRRFRCQPLMTRYFLQGEYAGVADLLRYEILLERGGFVAEADSECLRSVNPLAASDRPFTCYEIPPDLCVSLGMPRKKGLVCPILASPPGHPVVEALIDYIRQRTDPIDPPKPWKGTGNFLIRDFLRRNPPLAGQVTIHPAHYFVPVHYRGWAYDGPDEPFARQFWGTTRSGYADALSAEEKERRRADMLEGLMSWLTAEERAAFGSPGPT